MKLTCPRSGIKFSCDSGFGSATAIHPVFQIPAQKLLNQHLPPYIAGKLSTVEIHLFGAALLAKFPIDKWQVPLISPENLLSTWESNLMPMCKTLGRMDGRKLDKLPHYRITLENRDLRGLSVYLEAINEVIDNEQWSPIDRNERLSNKELSEKIAKIVRTTEYKLKERHRLPGLIAQWAAVSGNFPRDWVVWDKKKVTIREFWKELIVMAFSPDNVTQLLTKDIKQADFEELLDHCEQTIPFGSLHTDTLLKQLREAIDVLVEFKKPVPLVAPIDLDALMEKEPESETAYNENSETPIQMQAMSNEAGLLEPKRNMFSSNLDYMKARAKWRQAVLSAAAKKQGGN